MEKGNEIKKGNGVCCKRLKKRSREMKFQNWN